jgi:WD40 repeat protein
MTMSTDILIDAEHPWPGLESYGEYAQAWFHGRNQEAEDLLTLVRRETLTVLYGHSGLGKTSLLQAGLFPMLRREDFLPVRVDLILDEDSPELTLQIGEAIGFECNAYAVEVPAYERNMSLWEYFYSKECDFWSADDHLLTPVLIFDQFEKIFTLGRESARLRNRCDILLTELGDLIENRQPQALRSLLATDDTIASQFDPRRNGPRVILSFREDYLGDFSILYQHVRARTSNQLRLMPMDGLTAQNAIKTVANGRLSHAVAEQIVRFIDPKNQPLTNLQIEPTLLSLVCRELNEKRIVLKQAKISANMIQGDSAWQIIETFYKDSFDGLDARVKHFVEDRLLTKVGYRDSYALDNALSEPGVTDAALQTLVNRRLLRREEKDGLVRIELIHDVLAGVAKDSRNQRREAAALDEANQLLAKQKLRQRWMTFATLFLILMLTGISWLAWAALESRKEAYEQRQVAEKARVESDRNFGLALAEKAERAFSEQRFNDGQIYAAHALARLDTINEKEITASLIGARISNFGIPLLSTLRGHENRVWSIAFSPNGKLLAIGGSDMTIKVQDLTSGNIVSTLRGHNKDILSIAFSPDGKLVAAGGADKTVKIWNLSDGNINTVLFGHQDQVWSVAFSPNGKTLASGSSDKTVMIWDIPGGKVVTTLRGHEKGVRSVAFNPDGKRLASGSFDTTIKVWDIAGNKVITTLHAHEKEVFIVAFSTDGKTIASGSGDKTIKIWDIDGGKVIDTLRGHENSILSVTFSSRNSRILASGSGDNTIKIWDLDHSNKPVVTLCGHENAIRSVAFSPDSKKLASGSLDMTVKVWDFALNKTHAVLHGHENGVTSVVFSPDGKKLASGSQDKTIKLWDVVSGKTIATLRGHDSSVLSVAFSPDGRTLASGSFDKTINIWDLLTERSMVTLRENNNSVLSVAFSPDGKILASGCDKTIKLWDIPSGKIISTFQGHEKSVACVAFSPDGTVLASGSKDKTIKLWDIASGKTISTLLGHGDSVSNIAFSPDGKKLASGSYDRTIKLWDIASGKTISTLLGHEDSVFSIAFSPDGKILASGSYGKTIRLWDISRGAVVATLRGYQDTVRSVAFSVNGLLASGGMNNTVKLWSISDDEFEITNWRDHATKDETRYGLKLEGVSLVPMTHFPDAWTKSEYRENQY